jgi:mRNA interferase RelE/StbE
LSGNVRPSKSFSVSRKTRSGRVLAAVEGLRSDPKLTGRGDAYRIREGSYRVIYSVVASKLVIEVLRVGHRKDVYRK